MISQIVPYRIEMQLGKSQVGQLQKHWKRIKIFVSSHEESSKSAEFWGPFGSFPIKFSKK